MGGCGNNEDGRLEGGEGPIPWEILENDCPECQSFVAEQQREGCPFTMSFRETSLTERLQLCLLDAATRVKQQPKD